MRRRIRRRAKMPIMRWDVSVRGGVIGVGERRLTLLRGFMWAMEGALKMVKESMGHLNWNFFTTLALEEAIM